MTVLRNVKLEGFLDTNNSTNIPLGISEVFTGTLVNITNYGIIFINVYSDVASATDGLVIEQSSDGTNWDHDDSYTVPANVGKNYAINPHAKYLRVRYTNGADAQTSFRLQTMIKGNAKPSSHRIQNPITDDDDAELVKSVLTAELDGDGFDNIKATASGNLKVTDAENGLAIAKGDVTGTTYVHKFGSAPDFDTGDGRVTIWDGAEDGETWEKMAYTYSTTADIQYISSSDATDTQTVQLQGLDGSYNLVTQTKDLTGQTSAVLDTPLLRIFRMKNADSTDLAGHVFASSSTAAATGIPTTADIRCIIQPTNNQTEMALYTVPNGKTAYLRSWYSSSAGANKDTNIIIRVMAREQGGVWQLKHKMAWNGDFPYQHTYVEPEKFAEGVDIEMTAQLTESVTGAAVSAGFDIVLIDN